LFGSGRRALREGAGADAVYENGRKKNERKKTVFHAESPWLKSGDDHTPVCDGEANAGGGRRMIFAH